MGFELQSPHSAAQPLDTESDTGTKTLPPGNYTCAIFKIVVLFSTALESQVAVMFIVTLIAKIRHMLTNVSGPGNADWTVARNAG